MTHIDQKESRMTFIPKIFAIGAVFALLAGCTTGALKHDSAAAVEKRAVQRWNYLIAHQAEKAWDFLSPGFRATTTRETYAAAMNNRPVRWQSVKYDRASCNDDRCAVTLYVGYSLPMTGIKGPVESGSPQVENWIRVRGTWYFLPSG